MGVRVRVRFLLFYYELAPLIRDVTCSKLYFDGKKYEEAMSDEHPLFVLYFKTSRYYYSEFVLYFIF